MIQSISFVECREGTGMHEYNFENSKQEWRKTCEQKQDISIFMKDWYFDAVCDNSDDWKVITIKENNKVVAGFPFEYTRGKRFWRIGNPWMVPRAGIWIDYGNRSAYYKRNSFEEEICEKIIELLPYFDIFCISFHARHQNWMPFYKNGFDQRTYYSHVIYPENVNENILWSALQKYRRKEILKAKEKYVVKTNQDWELFYSFFEWYYRKKDISISFTKEKYMKLSNALQKNGALKIDFAYDEKDKLCAALYSVLDFDRNYTLFVAFDSTEKGARALLDWKGIIDAMNLGKIYDFEGSMLSGVSDYNSRFNAFMEPYFYIQKESIRLKKIQAVKEFLGRG